MTSAMPMPFQMSGFSPVINSNGTGTGTINFVVKIYPQRSSTEVKTESGDCDSLLEGVDLNDLFSDN